jgi:hypothetical protein
MNYIDLLKKIGVKDYLAIGKCLNDNLVKFEITNQENSFFFIANCSNESGGFTKYKESLYYTTAENIPVFLIYGRLIAEVEPKGQIYADPEPLNGNTVKWASNTSTIARSGSNMSSLIIKGLCLDAGQFGGNPTGSGWGLLSCNGGGWQKMWIDDKGMIRNGVGQCLDANWDTGNWYWNGGCDSNNTNQTGYRILKNAQNQSMLQHNNRDCLDVGNSNLHWGCDFTNQNQTITFG